MYFRKLFRYSDFAIKTFQKIVPLLKFWYTFSRTICMFLNLLSNRSEFLVRKSQRGRGRARKNASRQMRREKIWQPLFGSELGRLPTRSVLRTSSAAASRSNAKHRPQHILIFPPISNSPGFSSSYRVMRALARDFSTDFRWLLVFNFASRRVFVCRSFNRF